MKKLSFAVCAFLYSLCVGCLIIPRLEHTPVYFSRGQIDATALEFMGLGSTSREEVLLKLGEPDAVWEDERHFLYWWVTARGYAIVFDNAPPIWKKRYDLLIEFDDQGVVKRYGDIEEWARKGRWQKDLDLSTPIEIPVKHHRWTGDKDARLILGKDFFEFRDPSHNFRISPEKIILLRPIFAQDEQWAPAFFYYDIHFSEETVAGKKIRIRVDLFSLPTLLEYLRQNSPYLVVEN